MSFYGHLSISLLSIFVKTIEVKRGRGQHVSQNLRGMQNRNEREHNGVVYFIDLCNVMTNTNSAITTSQPKGLTKGTIICTLAAMKIGKQNQEQILPEQE